MDEFSRSTKILDAENKSPILEEVTKTYEYWIASPIFFTFEVTLVYGRLSEVICYMREDILVSDRTNFLKDYN
jgi:hypothetical protein